ncbi:hypothetical protein B0T26DRAFT_298961 [Lasiosphaeria miniovina]|uniref:Extracellular membrane protein CFEM domain-containing protein n=1 Tax=Lasiosphaeria miniovina TaxID=1954250 RepID=A0AA40AKJ4_9PEZI|nr:uncharacterized protein B0T26DRAFT_298961 [Lasiosphaeria miniovina]KAK0717535.1 hypothetical protein B0T26DRAFT_298961 [Lasiosphaeria miniovina]
MKLTVAIPVLLGAGTTQVYAQKIYIDKAPGYAELPPCAKVPVSTIVRDMKRGCGDGGRYTSFSCFCTASSSKFASVIGTDVAARCAASGIASQGLVAALSVFDSYCRVLSTGATTTAPATLAAPTLAAATATPAISSSIPTDTAVANGTIYSPVRVPTAPVPSPTAAGARVGAVKILPWACGAALALAVLM